jgi:hypothetical protein
VSRHPLKRLEVGLKLELDPSPHPHNRNRKTFFILSRDSSSIHTWDSFLPFGDYFFSHYFLRLFFI